MKRLAKTTALVAFFVCALVAPANAAFGLEKFDVTYTNQDGSPALQAGSHPFQMTTAVYFNKLGPSEPDGEVKDFLAQQIAGLIADPSAVPRCSTVDFLTFVNAGPTSNCANSTAVGYAATRITFEDTYAPVFNLVPPPGVALKLGFIAANAPITIEVGLKHSYPYNGSATVTNIPQSVSTLASVITLWGNPADPAHDPYRGRCVSSENQLDAQGHALTPMIEGGPFPIPSSYGNCPTNTNTSVPLLTLPRACQGPLTTTYAADSWQHPGALLSNGEPDLTDPNWADGAILTHDSAEPPSPLGVTGCAKLAFSPSIGAQPTTKAASSPTGLDFSLDVHDEGLTSPSGLANSDIRKSVVTLPEGFTTNPSLAEGLSVCSEADLERETVNSAPGEGCPNESKIGSVEVESPLLEENVNGSLFIATPYENPEGSLLALYIVIKNPTLGIIVKQPLRVENDPLTGQITTVAEDMPQLPFSHFKLHFREGTRSPLASPPACGTYKAKALLTPWSGGAPVETTSSFEIISGPDNGPCPSGGLPPFHPELSAGTINNAAGRFSPFDVKITRTDSEQEITHFSIKLPPGVAGKLAGIPYCSDAAIAQADSRTGPHGGQEELDNPSCPAASQVGRTLAGAGVGPSLAYAPGKLYLAGPYHGHPVSLVSITSGVVGPFDIGTVVVRLALDVNPETGEVFLDSTGSDPIPHIIKGIPLHVRDIRAYTDRPEFTFNPTSCEPSSTSATVLGSGLDFVSPADDNPFVSTSRFQAADCAALPFKPKLSLTLKGSTKRGGNPALHAHLAMNGFGEAGLAYAQTALPSDEFLDNAHIGTVCTRVIFKEGAEEGEKCPPGSLIGHAKAVTPILSEPLEGPIYLRSNPERNLPDIAAALHGSEISVVAVGHTDSAKGGGVRNTFEVIPDAPITSVDIDLFGGKKGLLENAPPGTATSICQVKSYATLKLKGHNGKQANSKTPINATGCKHKKDKRHAKRG